MTLAITLTGNGVTLHLQNSSGAATVGGAATAAATTPFVCVDEQYTIQAATPSPLWSGGPPLRDGSDNIDQSYENVSESIVVAAFGSSQDNLASIIRQLNQLLLAGTPVVFSVQPNGTTSALYTEILTATVQPTTDYQVQPLRGSATATLRISYVRRPYFGRVSSGETLINAQSFTNNGSGAVNTKSFSAGNGDWIYAGGPVNYTISSISGQAVDVWLASAGATIFDTTCAAAFGSSSTTPVATSTATAAISTSPITPYNRLKVRVLIRTDNMSANCRLGARIVTNTGATTTSTLWQSSYQPSRASGGVKTMIDLGDTPLDFFRLNNTTVGTFKVQPYYYSSDGSATAGSIVSMEVLFYYELCKITAPKTGGRFSFDATSISAFREVSNFPALPTVPEGMRAQLSGADVAAVLSGTPPRYHSGASLWAAWLEPNFIHGNTDTLTLTATHAPLYAVARGAG